MKNDDFEIKKISRREWYSMGKKQRPSVKRLRKERKQREAEELALLRYRFLEENYVVSHLSGDELACYVEGMVASAKGFDRVPPYAKPKIHYYFCSASPAERNWCSWLSGYDAYQMRHAINLPELVDGYAKILSKHEARSHQR